MSRWEYDTVFYRVFCITLLGVAFTFTVILTNVFVDIDGLLSKKDKVKSPKPPESDSSPELPSLSRVISVNMLPDDKSEETYDDKDYPDSDDLYRSKRSLEASKGILHIKDPKVKKLLTNHLAEFLDELDEENEEKTDKTISNIEENVKNINPNTQIYIKNKNKEKHEQGQNKFNLLSNNPKIHNDKFANIGEYYKQDKKITKTIRGDEIKPKKDYKSELLHLAMHNIILQGMVEHKNLDEVYNKVVDLVKDFEKDDKNINKDDIKTLYKSLENVDQRVRIPVIKASNEIIKNGGTIPDSRTFKKNINAMLGNMPDNTIVTKSTNNKVKDRNVVIKTVIDITALPNDKSNKDNDWNTKGRLNGIIKVIYNGNTLKFRRMDEESSTNTTNISESVFEATTVSNANSTNQDHFTRTPELRSNKSNPTYFHKMFYDYLRELKYESESSENQKLISEKRLKRHVKIRFDNNKTTVKPKTKKDDDELFVEIETHFDSKGTKGEKKKKLIRDLIEKIQSAIHSDKNKSNKKKLHWHVKKRIQNPLNSKSAAVLINKLILPFETLAHRHLDPISKSVPLHEDMPLVASVFDHNHWQRPFYGPPRFFNKFINSAEMNTFDADYNKVMRHNGIPQRLQKPLNTDMSDEIFYDSKVYDMGNIKFLMKDIDGSGFSIGFNQYTDEAPDTETMKLFSGLENIIQTYHQQYDQENTPNNQQQSFYEINKNITPDEIDPNEEDFDQTDQHVIQRRSILGSDETEHIANNYRVVSGHSVLPYKNYDDIFNSEKGHMSHVKNMKLGLRYRSKKSKKSSFLLDEHVFEKDLKPAEILSIADFFQRRKRSLKVKKISNVNIKTKINRYLNTRKMASKSIFKNNKKRAKRQIDKIRIIARDLPQNRASDEEIMFAESDEKILADRALIREIDMPELDPNDKPQSIEHYDIISPQKDDEPYDIVAQSQKTSEDHYDILTPYVYEPSPFETPSFFSRRARHNSLMSKYPHIIMEEAPNYAAPSYTENTELYAVDDSQPQQYEVETTTPVISTIMDAPYVPLPTDQEISDLISPPRDNANYRVSVKIRPKNVTGMSGYKEVHTSINKSYNKNGLMYTSLVNVSQLSKVEKVSKNMTTRRSNDEIIPTQDDALKHQQEIIKAMIQQHKLRLDQQLKHLQMERMKLESFDSDNVDNVTEIVQPNETTTKARKGRKANQNTDKRKTKPETTTIKVPPKTRPVTNRPTTTIITTTEYVQPPIEDHFKTKMIETIERNENITNELLKKIDQNTGVLEIFLGKLIQTMEVPSRKLLDEVTTKKIEPTTTERVTERQPTNKVGYNQQMDRNVGADNHLPFNFEDYHYMPSMLFRNMPKQVNNSLGIPFVYAVQHPYGAVSNKDMASVVYHGHIHTSPLNDNKIIKRDNIQKRSDGRLNEKQKNDKKTIDTGFWKPKPGEKVLHDFVVNKNKNSSRFFLDETRNDFKIPLLVNDNSTKV